MKYNTTHNMKDCYYYYISLQMQSIIRLFFISITKRIISMLKNLSQRLSRKNMFWQFQSVKHVQLLIGGDQHKYIGFLC
jgi:hypothetical protein